MTKQVLSTVACMFITLSILAQTINDMNTSKNLTPRQLSLAECACLEAQGDMRGWTLPSEMLLATE